MKLGSLASARPAYWDRNPTERADTYENTLAPHSYTTRFTYTVAAGKKAFVDTAFCATIRGTVATVAGDVLSKIALTPISATTVPLIRANQYANTYGEKTYQNLGGSILVLAGGVLIGQTYDSSTGGQCAYNLSYHLVEFDA